MKKQRDAVSVLSLASPLLLATALLLAAAPMGSADTPMGLAGAAPADEPSARIEFTETAFDFGAMYQNEEVTHLFIFRNVGSAPLNIGKVKSSCGCTAAMPEKRELPPGGQTNLKVTFRSGSMRDRIVKHIYIDSNDPVEPRITLTVRGEVKVEVEVSPRGVYVGSIQVGETVRRTIEVTPVGVDTFKILSTSVDSPLVEVGRPLPLDDKRPGYKLVIKLGPLKEPGRINAKVTVCTDLPHTKEFQIPVYGKVAAAEDADQDSPQQ